MSTVLLNSAELAVGFEALVKALGWVNAVRFVQQYEGSVLDYTKEREGMLPELGVRELIERMKEGNKNGDG